MTKIKTILALITLCLCGCAEDGTTDSQTTDTQQLDTFQATDTESPDTTSNDTNISETDTTDTADVEDLSCTPSCGGLSNVAWATCQAGQCIDLVCDIDFADCDQNPANGCETYLETSPKHCGKCGVNCSTAAHVGSVSCEAGVCVINACAQRFADCDQNPDNGCETNSAQPDHCNASQSCDGPVDPSLISFSFDGTRALAPADLFIDCTDPASFGAPPNSAWTCQPSPNGAQFECALDQCLPGFAACDPAQPTLCEAFPSTQHCGFCGNTCPTGATCAASPTSGNLCVCGDGGERCHPTGSNYIGASCAGTDCILTCQPSWVDCDGFAENGCEHPITSGSCHPVCGDAEFSPQNAEACDDGNTQNDDGCSDTCAIEPDYLCFGAEGGLSVCFPVFIGLGCGDGVQDINEECDPSPTGSLPTQACDIDCTFSVCGDGRRNAAANETCDDGNFVSGDGCSDTCNIE